MSYFPRPPGTIGYDLPARDLIRQSPEASFWRAHSHAVVHGDTPAERIASLGEMVRGVLNADPEQARRARLRIPADAPRACARCDEPLHGYAECAACGWMIARELTRI